MQEDLREYFERIEEAFCRNRLAPLLLSPLDFERAVEWHAAGVPLDVVESGIAAYFEHLAQRKVPLRRAICLSFAEDHVLKALEAHRVAAVGRAAGLSEPEPKGARVTRFLESRAAALEAFSSDSASMRAMPLLSRFCARAALDLRDLMLHADQPAVKLETRLAPLDREMCGLVLLESPQPLAEGWRRSAVERLGTLAEGMESGVLRQTVDRLACQTALAHWHLPRLSLLYLEE